MVTSHPKAPVQAWQNVQARVLSCAAVTCSCFHMHISVSICRQPAAAIMHPKFSSCQVQYTSACINKDCFHHKAIALCSTAAQLVQKQLIIIHKRNIPGGSKAQWHPCVAINQRTCCTVHHTHSGGCAASLQLSINYSFQCNRCSSTPKLLPQSQGPSWEVVALASGRDAMPAAVPYC